MAGKTHDFESLYRKTALTEARQIWWAVSTVMTRQNSVPGEDGRPSLALIPFYDMANHANGPFSSGWNAEKRWCECLCPRDVKAGEQVFIFYGVRSNGEFLVHNGFVYPENEEDVVALRLGLGRSGSDPGVERKLRILSRLGMASPHTFSLSPRRHPFESGDLLAFLRLFHLTPVEVSKFEGNEEKLREPGMFSQELDSKCKEFLQNRISLLLRAYPRSLQEDEGLLSSGDSLSHRGRLAVSLTMTEKKIFNCLLQHLNDS
ncbi:unnamed protein product [Darwinula stevensoni]|uniref:protein-histidine N-methyltransferase n=1 Tax=Darwinula stevensoni TaxID=69355 RepID=A0A7R8X4H9_9CRUS|nr:unnamed protein product [Darwinula stevensoni]CAG0886057.1 unnamed protein product [Darwinula stevensoni]